MVIAHSEDFYLKKLFENIKIREVMKTPVVTVYEDDELSAAEQMLVQHSLSYLPVVNHAKEVVGLLSQKYLYKAQSPRRILKHEDLDYDPGVLVDGESYYEKEMLDGYILRNIMKKDPFTLGPEATLAEAILNMDSRIISCIPIVEKNKIRGIVTIREIVTFVAKIL